MPSQSSLSPRPRGDRRTATPAFQLTILNQSGQAVPQPFLHKWVADLGRLAIKRIGPKRYPRRLQGRELLIIFLDEKTARQLNKRYRARNYATDVLSFESVDDESLGELVICPSVIAKQAREHGLLVREELGYMVLHGFLHLLGFDHEVDENAAREMFELQDALFDELLKLESRRKRRKAKRTLKPAR